MAAAKVWHNSSNYMKNFCIIPAFALLLTVTQTAVAQSSSAAQQSMLSDTESSASAAGRVAYSTLTGKVVDADGQPLVGATLLIKGTRNACITDGQGRYRFDTPVTPQQVLLVEAAGYVGRNLTPAECALTDVTLQRDPAVRVKRGGKRAGQVTRSGNAFLQ